MEKVNKEFDVKLMGKRIKELRQGKEIYQEDLGKLISIGQSTIAAYENGRARPSFEVLFKLADFFNTSVDYILGRIDIE